MPASPPSHTSHASRTMRYFRTLHCTTLPLPMYLSSLVPAGIPLRPLACKILFSHPLNYFCQSKSLPSNTDRNLEQRIVTVFCPIRQKTGKGHRFITHPKNKAIRSDRGKDIRSICKQWVSICLYSASFSWSLLHRVRQATYPLISRFRPYALSLLCFTFLLYCYCPISLCQSTSYLALFAYPYPHLGLHVKVRSSGLRTVPLPQTTHYTRTYTSTHSGTAPLHPLGSSHM